MTANGHLPGSAEVTEAHPEEMRVIARQIADTLAGVQECIRQIDRSPVPTQAFGKLASPVAAAGEQAHHRLLQTLRTTANVVDATQAAIGSTSRSFDDMDDGLAYRFNRVTPTGQGS